MSDYSATFPSQRPIYSQDFSNGSKIDPRATFSRASTGSYFGTAKHLSSENLLTPSTPDSSWTRARLTPTYSQTGPYAGANATLHTEQAITNTAYIGSANYVTVANTSYTYSVWVKQNTGSRNYYQLRVGGLGAGVPFVTYHLSGAGSIDEFGGSYLDSYSITAGPTGWYKLTMSITPTSASSSTYFFLGVGAPSGGELPSITGDTGNSFLVFGAQVSSTGESVLNETSTQIHREYAPTLQTAASGAARFEHSATDGQSMGCLIEGQSTNLLSGSATIGGTYWGVVNATAQQNSAVAPDGTLTAATLVENSAAGAKYAYTNNFTPAASTTYTFSAFVKPNGRNFCMIYTGVGGVNQSSMFNLITGATSNLSGSATNRATQCGNGWWRLSVTVTTTNTTTANFQILPATDATTFDYTGNGYSGLICWGAMLEQSSFASSYIGTTSSTATRAADSLSVATADIGYTGGPMTLVTDTSVSDPTTSDYGAAAYVFVDSNNSAGIWATSADNRIARVETNGVGGNVGTNSGVNGKAALSIDTNDIATCLNGGTVATDTSHALADFGSATLYIGNNNSAYHLNGHLKRIALYSEALSDTNLQAITS